MGNCNWINTNNNNNNNCNCNTQNNNTQTCNTTKNYNNQATTTQNDCCCCAGSFRRALNLLSDPALAPYINFDGGFAFVLDDISVGGYLDDTTTAGSNNPNDNLVFVAAPNAATFNCVDCNLIRISGAASFYREQTTGDTPVAPAIPLNRLSLCDLVTVKLQVVDELFTTAANPVAINECVPNCTISNFNNFKAYFRSLLDKQNVNKNTCKTTCDDCCCDEDILSEINSCTGPRRTTVNIAAASWFGTGLEVLGQIGCVLVLTDNNTTPTGGVEALNPNIFFVCVDRISGFTAS